MKCPVCQTPVLIGARHIHGNVRYTVEYTVNDRGQPDCGTYYGTVKQIVRTACAS